MQNKYIYFTANASIQYTQGLSIILVIVSYPLKSSVKLQISLQVIIYKQVISLIIIRNKIRFFFHSYEFGKNVISEISGRLLIGQNGSLGVLLLVDICIEFIRNDLTDNFGGYFDYLLLIVMHLSNFLPIFLFCHYPPARRCVESLKPSCSCYMKSF